MAGLLIAPREPCNPTCAFSKWTRVVSWVILWGKGGPWSQASRSRIKEQPVLHLSHSSCSPQCPRVHICHIPALPVSATGKLSVHCFQLSNLGGEKRRDSVPHLNTVILGPQEMTLKEMPFSGQTAQQCYGKELSSSCTNSHWHFPIAKTVALKISK